MISEHQTQAISLSTDPYSRPMMSGTTTMNLYKAQFITVQIHQSELPNGSACSRLCILAPSPPIFQMSSFGPCYSRHAAHSRLPNRMPYGGRGAENQQLYGQDAKGGPSVRHYRRLQKVCRLGKTSSSPSHHHFQSRLILNMNCAILVPF